MAGTLINQRYRVLRSLGDGSDAAVFLVKDEAVGGAQRALKRVGTVDPAARDRLAGEFARLCRLSHPNLVAVHRLEEVTEGSGDLPLGSLFLTADYVPGEQLTAFVARLSLAERSTAVIAVAEQVASALAHIHAAGLVHCDVKPANIVVSATAGAITATLLDLGLAAVRGSLGPARGSAAYLAPEALASSGDPRSDLYALAASLYHALAGSPPYGALDARHTLEEIARRRAPRSLAGEREIPAALSELLDRMLAPSPDARPSTALVVLDELERVREALGLPAPARRPAVQAGLLPPRLIGREAEVAQIAGVLARADEPDAVRRIRVIGPPGIGRRAIVEHAIRRQEVAAAAGTGRPIEVLTGPADRLWGALGLDSAADRHQGGADPASIAAAAADRALAKLAERARKRRCAVVLGPDGGDRRLAAMARAATLPGIVIIEIVDATAGDDRQAAADLDSLDRETLEITLTPLSVEQIADVFASMIGRDPERDTAAEIHRASAGVPGFAVEIFRAAHTEGISIGEILAGDGPAALAQLIVRRVAGLPAEQAALLEIAAVAGGEIAIGAAISALGQSRDAICAVAAELAAAGFAAWSEGGVRLPSMVHTRAIDSAMPEPRKRTLHRALARWHEAQPAPDPIAVARHLIVAGPADRAARACLEAARRLAAHGRAAEAVDMAERAAAGATGALTSDALVELAELAIAAGDYSRALSASERGARSRDPERKRRAMLATARAHQKRGDLAAAEAAFAAHLNTYPDDDVARGMYARLLVSRARYREAAEMAGDIAALSAARPLPDGAAARLESAGLARLYLGEPDLAVAAFDALRSAAEASADRALLGRALGLLGMAAQARGDIAAAAALYHQAAEHARAAGDIHAAAVYNLNQATAHSERGRFGQALTALGAAFGELRKLGDVAELPAALFNRGVALLAVGEIDAAKRAAQTAHAAASARGTPQWQLLAHILAGDVARRERDLPRAIGCFEQALELGRDLGSGRDRLYAGLALAEALAENNDPRARDALSRAQPDATSDEDHDRVALSRARVELALGGDPDGAAGPLDVARGRARSAGRIDLAWRADVVAARLAAARGGVELAAKLARSARHAFDELLADAPEARRHGLRSDPDAQFLSALETELRVGSLDSPPGRARDRADVDSERQLRRLLLLSRRLNSELRLEPLLDLVIDTAIELTSAERGFLLLGRPGGETLDVVVARNIDHGSLSGEDLRLSRSIAERAARAGEVVLTVDAAFDERFGAAASVAAMRLRSVLAVPLRQKGRTTGTIYVDHRFRTGAFDDEAVELARELADIAAVAIENARLIEENRKRQEEIVELNRRLQEDLGDREVELLTVKAQLGSDRRELRHAYAGIIGRSPRMLDMLRMVDRAAEAALPVVIHGESGTGKELVARALHDNGPRRQAPFVAINCGAVPEQLLESELFGHVRGAFTGADRDRRGVFEVASGGTLFLDEIADTGPAMQAKLLRVLQDGLIRRVGDDQVRRVDVRVVTASNRRLADLVAAGTFREDLYYRLNVLSVEVPALRDRLEDIPAIAHHVLARLAAGGEPPRITRAALARLAAYRWPGNVRELENELARAWALADRAIDVGDLSPHIAAATLAEAVSDDSDLELKRRVESLERTLVERALTQTQGNQSAAAKLLGLSRYGLQKKLRRYGIAGSVR